MSLFNSVTYDANEEVETAKQTLDLAFGAIVQNYKKEHDRFWNNMHGFTPQEMADAWGQEVLLLFERSTKTREYILNVDADALGDEYINPPMTITVNQDGTVTLS